MTNRRPALIPRARLAFARIEAIALAFIVLIMAALMLATAPYERRTAMLNRDLANLRQIGAWTFAYANDFEDLHPSFSFAPNSTFPDIRALASGTPLRQAVGHAIDIIRRRTGRDALPLPRSWFPHIWYTHLVLADYTQRKLPDATFVSTGDKHRLNWLDDPINKHDQGFWQPFQNFGAHWPYSASFQTPPAWYDKNPGTQRLAQGSSHSQFFVPNIPLGGRELSAVTYPAQKMLAHDYGAWHFTKQPQFFAHETARVTVLMGDGGASARLTADSNRGWRPNDPTLAAATVFEYSPRSWEPPKIAPTRPDRLIGHYRWTRGGLEGRDFDGPEIDTGQY